MPPDPGLANRLRRALSRYPNVTEKKMFGGIAFMLRGNMCCGVIKKDMMARVGPAGYEKALAEPHARPMDFTGKPLKGFVYVGAKGVADSKGLRRWVKRAADFALSLPAK